MCERVEKTTRKILPYTLCSFSWILFRRGVGGHKSIKAARKPHSLLRYIIVQTVSYMVRLPELNSSPQLLRLPVIQIFQVTVDGSDIGFLPQQAPAITDFLLFG